MTRAMLPALAACLLASQASARPPVQLPHAPEGLMPLALQLRADRLSYQQGGARLTLKGNVVVSSSKLTVRAKLLRVHLDKQGQPYLLAARGAVRFTVGKTRGSARKLRVRLAPKSRAVELLGDARLELDRPGLNVQGERISLELTTGRLTVEKPRVDLRRVEASGG